MQVDSDGDVRWSMPSTCCAQKHPFPSISGRRCYFSNVQRINLTNYFMMLEVRHDLGFSPWGCQEVAQRLGDSVAHSGLSSMSRPPQPPTLKPFFQYSSSLQDLDGSIEGPFLCSLLQEKQAPPHFQSHNFWQVGHTLSFTHSSEVFWAAEALPLLFSHTPNFLHSKRFFYTWKQDILLSLFSVLKLPRFEVEP